MLSHIMERQRKRDERRDERSEDADRQFLLSLLPDLKALNPIQKRAAKTEIMSVFNRYLGSHEYEWYGVSQPPSHQQSTVTLPHRYGEPPGQYISAANTPSPSSGSYGVQSPENQHQFQDFSKNPECDH